MMMWLIILTVSTVFVTFYPCSHRLAPLNSIDCDFNTPVYYMVIAIVVGLIIGYTVVYSLTYM